MTNTDFDFTGDPFSDELAKRFAPEKPQRVSTAEEAARLSPGTSFIGPDEKERVVPYKISHPEQIANLPDGANFVGPDGKLRQKPRYEGVDFTAQTLYDMGVNDKERRRALERSYPGKVREDPAGGFYVDDEGTLRKPGRGIQRFTGAVSAAAAPTILSVLGALGGGAVGGTAGAVGGSVVPGPGTVAGGLGGGTAGAAAGGAGGAILGQSFNDLILGIAGVYDRSRTEEAAELAIAGAGGMAGAGVGRGISTVVPSLRSGVSALSAAAPGAVRSFLGAEKEGLATARELSEKGVLVPPSAWAKEAPHLQNVVEVFDPAFHTNKPLLESATAHYEKSAGAILNELGIKDPGSLTKPIAGVPTKETGEVIMRRTLGEMADADAKMRAALEQRQAAIQAGQPAMEAQRESLQKAAVESQAAAQKLIDQGYKDIANDIDTAMRVAKAGHNSGDLWGAIGQKLVVTRRAVGARHSKMYDEADIAAGGNLPNIEGLPESAQAFLDQLPPDFQSRYPDMVRKLRDLAGVRDSKTGEFIKEPFNPTFGQLHDIRSQFRQNVNYYDLAPDIKEGTFKFFATKVDQVLHDGEAVPELKEAARLLDLADKSYAENIKIFNAQQIKAVMKGLEAGEPADPQNLYNIIIRSGQTDLTNRLKEMIGPNLWAGVKAADMQSMLDASRTLTKGVINGKDFAREVLARVKDGTLKLVHGDEGAEKLAEQARRIEMLAGREPIPVRLGDTATQVLARARQAQELAKAQAKQDPLKTLNQEMKKIQIEHAKEVAKLRAERRNDLLGFLYNPTTGASEAVDRILNNEDLIIASAARFGEKSPEFEMLRQVWAQRFLTGGMRPSQELSKVSPEIQQLMFPEITINQMKTLAKEMDFLLDTRAFKTGGAGSSMSAFAKVEHPASRAALAAGGYYLGGPIGAAAGLAVPPVARLVLGTYYRTIRKLATSPATMRWIEKGLNGSPADREAVRQSIQAVLHKGSAVGAGAGEATVQSAGPK